VLIFFSEKKEEIFEFEPKRRLDMKNSKGPLAALCLSIIDLIVRVIMTLVTPIFKFAFARDDVRWWVATRIFWIVTFIGSFAVLHAYLLLNFCDLIDLEALVYTVSSMLTFSLLVAVTFGRDLINVYLCHKETHP
jgi:hypothetical protein